MTTPPSPQPPPAAPLLEMIGVTVVASRNPAIIRIENLDWTIQPGEFWVVGGPPDSGKTDLLATAACLSRPMRGRHRLFGQDTRVVPTEQFLPDRLRVGVVFADGGRLLQQLTVTENLALPWCYHHNCSFDAAADRVRSLLAAHGLEFLAAQPCHRLGRPWRQRVALARALMLGPDLLFLDNPTGGLNPGQIDWWMDWLDRLHTGHAPPDHRPITLVVATDDLRPWCRPGRQFAILHQNRWRLLGNSDKLADCTELAVRELLGERS